MNSLSISNLGRQRVWIISKWGDNWESWHPNKNDRGPERIRDDAPCDFAVRLLTRHRKSGDLDGMNTHARQARSRTQNKKTIRNPAWKLWRYLKGICVGVLKFANCE